MDDKTPKSQIEKNSSVDESDTAGYGKSKKSRVVIFANVTVVVIIAIVIFGFISYVNGRHYVRFDFTTNSKFTLSSKTKNILKNLDKPVTITVLFNPEEMFYTQINDILDEYAYLSRFITIEQIDPLRNPEKADDFAKKLKLQALELNSIAFQCGERNKHVLQRDVMELAYPFKFIGEEAFTSAILSVSEEKQTAVFFTMGHGEREIDEFDRYGFSSVVESVKRDNFKVIALDLLGKKEIPDNCEVLVIAGPTKPFSTEEINIIRGYLGNNGKLLVMLEPAFDPNLPTGLKPMLQDYGVKLRDDVLIYNKERNPMLGFQLVSKVHVSKDEYQEHKITKDMSNLSTVFFGACGIETVKAHGGQGIVNRNVVVKPLAYAPDQAWGEVTIMANVKPVYSPDEDLSGPISLAVAVEQVDPNAIGLGGSHEGSSLDKDAIEGTRIVVFTDVDFAANEFIRNPGNQDLLRNSVNWLAKKETQLGIAGKLPEFRTASITPDQMSVIFWLSIGGLPLITIISGAVIWWKRRR